MKDGLDSVLDELRRKHREVSAPPHLEPRLRAATRASRARPMQPWIWAAAAMLIMAVVTWKINQPSPAIISQERTSDRDIHGTNASPAPAPSTASTTIPAANSRNLVQPETTMTDFVVVPGSEVLPVPAATSILRMELTKGELRRYGVDVLPTATTELVRADFVVGDDGLARALRFVR